MSGVGRRAGLRACPGPPHVANPRARRRIGRSAALQGCPAVVGRPEGLRDIRRPL